MLDSMSHASFWLIKYKNYSSNSNSSSELIHLYSFNSLRFHLFGLSILIVIWGLFHNWEFCLMICIWIRDCPFFYTVGGIFTNEIGISFSVFFFCIVMVYGFFYFPYFVMLFSLIGNNIYIQMGWGATEFHHMLWVPLIVLNYWNYYNVS